MPNRRRGEERQAFITRCMGDAEATRDFPERDQRFAVCTSLADASPNSSHPEPCCDECAGGTPCENSTQNQIPGDMALSFHSKDGELWESCQKLRINLVGAATRRETIDAVEFLVVEMNMIVEGVLNGLMYNQEILPDSIHLWNNIPVTVRHPRGPRGEPASARTPENLQTYRIGNVFHPVIDGNRLRAEAWIDINLAESKAPGLIDRIEAGEFLEISTGVFTRNDGQAGTFDGSVFTGSVTSMTPDHLAILPDETGACSVADGCGLNQNTEEESMNKEKYLEQLLANAGHEFHEIMSQLQRLLDGMDTNFAIHWLETAMDDGTFVMRVDLIEENSRHTVLREGNFEVSEAGAVSIPEQDFVDVERGFIPTENEAGDATPKPGQNQAQIQGGSEMDRTKQIDALIANSDWVEEDREALIGLTDNSFARVIAANDDDDAGDGDGGDGAGEGDAGDGAASDSDGGDGGAADGADGGSAAPAPDAENVEQGIEEALGGIKNIHVRNYITNAVAQDMAKVTVLVDQLLENESCPFSKEELLTKNSGELEKLKAFGQSAAPEGDATQNQSELRTAINNYLGAAPAGVTANVGALPVRKTVPVSVNLDEAIKKAHGTKTGDS